MLKPANNVTGLPTEFPASSYNHLCIAVLSTACAKYCETSRSTGLRRLTRTCIMCAAFTAVQHGVWEQRLRYCTGKSFRTPLIGTSKRVRGRLLGLSFLHAYY
jgi:hypothetical protein